MEDTIMNKILDKKIDYRDTVAKDFAMPNELTVEITLREYRELVSGIATKQHDIEEARKDRWKIMDENSRLKEENENLRKKLVNLMEPCQSAEEEEEEEDDE
jgi:predicted  nucleic acid-binding Zn-ribbon protein